MYAWYKRELRNQNLHLIFEEEASLGGCKNGIIASEIKKILSENSNPPAGWIIPISDIWNREGYSFIIDIKPSGDEIFLCELDKVIGFSYEEWSPVMLRLKRLYSNLSLGELDKKEFLYPGTNEVNVIYTILYYQGSFRDGEIIGKWSPPYGSITGVLFWPEAMSFFYEQAKKLDPDFLLMETNIIAPKK